MPMKYRPIRWYSLQPCLIPRRIASSRTIFTLTGSRKNGRRYLCRHCTVFTSPEGLIMVIDCSNSWNLRKSTSNCNGWAFGNRYFRHVPSPCRPYRQFCQLASKYPLAIYKNAYEYESTTYQNAMDKVRQLKIREIMYTGILYDRGVSQSIWPG